MKTNLILAILLAFTSCTKQPALNTSGDSPRVSAQAIPFKGEIYRTSDDRQAITLVSPDELELRTQGTNLICKYTKQDNTLRVVATIMGTTQALYYRTIPQGLQANDGTLFLSPTEFGPHSKRSQASQVLEDLRMIDAAIDQYAIEHNKKTGDPVTFSDLQNYIRKGTDLYKSGGKDMFGNLYNGGSFAVDSVPKVSPATFNMLSDVAPAEFWSPFK